MYEKNPLALSDEEFLKQGRPFQTTEEETPPANQEEVSTEENQEETTEEQNKQEETTEEKTVEKGEKPNDQAAGNGDAGNEPGSELEKLENEPNKVPESDGTVSGNEKEKKPDAEKVETPDYEKFYQQIMQPIKANGRTIELKSAEEAVRLMQMGAGYTKKLQELQPVLKTVRMLEKADLLDEGKLSYLIDIHNKNPEAIKKLIKESGIDPLDLNPGDNVSYVPGNHSVSDAEMAFNEALSEVTSRENGQKVIDAINQTWDQKSIELLYQHPEILGVIQSQHESGIYPIIVAEIDRQKSFGNIPSTTPFLTAYKTIGDRLTEAGAFKHLTEPAPQRSPQTATSPGQEPTKPQQQAIATRAAVPKPQVTNGARAQAAAPTATTPKKVAPVVNPLAMPDDEFMKQMAGRL